MYQINRFIDKETGRKSVGYLINKASEYFKEYQIYSIYTSEIVVVLPDKDIEQAHAMGKAFVDKFFNPVYIDGIPVDYFLICGIVNFPIHGKDYKTIIQKLGITINQAQVSCQDIAVYDENFAQKNIENYNLLVSFYEALKEDQLKLVYQPKIDLKSNRVMGVEALLRWNNDNNINISRLIKTVEEAGFISELSKWVIKNAIIQLKHWQELGLNISVAVNLSSKDLIDNSIVHYTKKYIKEYGVNPVFFEYELTERTLIQNSGSSVNYLYDFKDMGLSISLDDYGTGYNSLMNIVKLPLDYIKIDKYFIDHIYEVQGQKLMEDMINLIHNLGKKVCAEGVETKNQLQILNDMDCDYIQGYYFSKPLSAEQVVETISDLNKKINFT